MSFMVTDEEYEKIMEATLKRHVENRKRYNISEFILEAIMTYINNGYDPPQPTETIQETIPETKPEESTTNPFEGIEF